MQGFESIAELLPHQGSMCFWEQVVDWDTTRIVLCSDMHRDLVHPLRDAGRLHAVHLCEYGAQAMAVHGGLLGREIGRPVRQGMLVALRAVTLYVDRFDDLPQALHGEAAVLLQGEDSQQYTFRIFHVGQLLAEGRAVVMLD
ncbi:phosphotransferase [Xylella taiwanensis]|uniref:Phosphotransferase n=1 Tax=Xylella taiwanensis TaxID=1444770 RepID=Z9JNJ9_9GAMM|nr:phosphotransferase [Xylella taiwanensis]AXI84515.1 phosphotransferase [Xylella taiwanensis]EWS79337.1 phosphotransferase [Xylella taiwanensis]MCD8455416.1 phosphotransferase [Xylella taiwanensis]MCD8457820.1 phosphotransferase [Xylella taiwanensis]MCD8459956.1 phosphotransferase [Xylella taiwanensis]